VAARHQPASALPAVLRCVVALLFLISIPT
jgi:hypothetical protein